MKSKVRIKADTTQFINQAWVRNGDSIITGEALILVCLLHSTGRGRDSEDFKELQRIMNDPNLDDKE